jgi:hypothetical protein
MFTQQERLGTRHMANRIKLPECLAGTVEAGRLGFNLCLCDGHQ